MKNLLVLALALTTVSAFAQKSMITFGGFNDGGASSTFDFSHSTSDNDTLDGTVAAKETSTTNVMVNYTYAITGSWMAGVKLGNHAEATSANNFTTTGVQGYYNIDGTVNDTCYVGLHYTMVDSANDDKATAIALEYGHRFALGAWKGLNLTFSPSISYSTTTTDFDAANTDDLVETALAWNWIKFDVLF
jgi:hypothetical protein